MADLDFMWIRRSVMSEEETHPEQWSVDLANCVIIFAGILGIIFNSITLLTLPRMKNQQPITILVINLAATDLIYCCFMIPSHVLYNTIQDESWWKQPVQGVYCDVSAWFRFTTFHIDVTTVGIIAIER